MIWLGLPAPGLVSYGEDGLGSRDRDLWWLIKYTCNISQSSIHVNVSMLTLVWPSQMFVSQWSMDQSSHINIRSIVRLGQYYAHLFVALTA